MPEQIILNEQELRKYYCEEAKTKKEIANIMNCHSVTISKAIKNLGLIPNYKNPEWLKHKHHVEKMKIGEIAQLACCNFDTITRYMRENDIETLHEVRYSGVTKYSLNRDYFSVIDTEEKAYWLGFIVADGAIIKEACNTYRISIMLSKKDEEHLDKFKKAISSNAKLEYGETLLDNKSFPYVKLRINSSKMCQDLMDKNVMPNKSTREEVPFDIPFELKKHFIRGLFDGDGCFSYYFDKKRSKFVCSFNLIGSNQLLEPIHKELFNLFPNKTTIRKIGSIYSFTIGTRAEDIMDWLYEDASVFLDRKRDKFEEWLLLKKI